METLIIKKINYYPEGDTLWIDINLEKPAYESMTEYDFYIFHDMDRPSDIVGFKIIEFSQFITHINEKDVLPKLNLKFNVPDLNLKSVSLKQLIENAYNKFILKREKQPQKMAL